MVQISGVRITLSKQDRVLQPEADGFVGKLYSGPVVLEVQVASNQPIIGIQQKGRDQYYPLRDWMGLKTVPAEASPLKTKRWWYQTGTEWYRTVGVNLPPGTQFFRHKMELDAGKTTANSFVPYPNNLVALARYEPIDGGFSNVVRVWKIALVSQHDDQYFLSVQQMYETTAHRCAKNCPCYPRLRKHRTLEALLVANMPDGIVLPAESEYQDDVGPNLKFLRGNQGLVVNWYEARGMGVILTREGEARVSWRDVPGRPRRAFLVPGEVVSFDKVDTPTKGEKTIYRSRPRKSRIALQAYGIQPLGKHDQEHAA